MTFVDEFDFRYAMTYSYNNRQEVDFDSELSELTDLAYLSGYINIVFYERKDGFWVEIDARKEMAESQKRREQEKKDDSRKLAEWKVWVWSRPSRRREDVSPTCVKNRWLAAPRQDDLDA